MGIIKAIGRMIDYEDTKSPAYRFRLKRMYIFTEWFERTYAEQLQIAKDSGENKKIRILDVGGTLEYWITLRFKYLKYCSVTLLNLEEKEVPEKYRTVFSTVSGNAGDMHEYEDNSFDLIFSNSVIEHLGEYNKQVNMLAEMKRIAKHRYIQTPNKYFPIEPHYKFPMFQFFPLKLKMWLVSHYNLRYHKAIDKEDALRIASEVRLMSYGELRKLLPGVKINKEKVGILTKSFYAFF